MSTVEPRRLLDRDEELRPIGILASIGHGQPPGAVVLQLEVLIRKAIPIDAATWRGDQREISNEVRDRPLNANENKKTSSAVPLREVTPLDHEVLDHPVELAAFVPLALRQLGEFHEVLDRLRDGFAEQADLHSARVGAADLNIEPYLRGRK